MKHILMKREHILNMDTDTVNKQTHAPVGMVKTFFNHGS